jgi:hypothetical protein
MTRTVKQALQILSALGFPRAQQNERSALCLLALTDMTKEKTWRQASNPLMGITPIMDWARLHYLKKYAPNTRETIRRRTMHQFVEAGVARYNPDNPGRAVNSPHAVYQIGHEVLELLRMFGEESWADNLAVYLSRRQTLKEKYARTRELAKVPVDIVPGRRVQLSPGGHSELIKAVIESFAPRFVPGGVLVYAGDTGEKWGYLDETLLASLNLVFDVHGKMPDVMLFDRRRNWLLLVEAVTSHGPMDAKRHDELAALFSKSTAGLVYVTAFPDRSVMARYLDELAWESEVWVADAPTHLIHFNGSRYLGPYEEQRETPLPKRSHAGTKARGSTVLEGKACGR